MKFNEMMNLKRGDNVYCHHDGKKVKMVVLGLKCIDYIEGEKPIPFERPLDESIDEINIKNKSRKIKAACIYDDIFTDKDRLEKEPWLLKGIGFSYRQIHMK